MLFPIEAGHIMLFARAIGDANPAYSRQEYAHGTEVDGIVAPPTFMQAAVHYDPEYPHRPRIGEPWRGSGRTATGIATPFDAGPARLHAEQSFEYFVTVRPGDVLEAASRPGDTWHKDGRSGRLIFEETITDFCNQRAELAVRSRTVAVTVVPVPPEAGRGD